MVVSWFDLESLPEISNDFGPWQASGSQLVPEIVHKSSSVLHIFRTPQWYIPAAQIPYGPIMRWILRNVYFARKMLRFLMFFIAELAFRGSSLTPRALRTRLRWQRNAANYIKSLAPTEYHDLLIPKYEMGCKVWKDGDDFMFTENISQRPVFNTGYLQCLHNPKVKLLPHEASVTTDSVICQGETFPVDVIILATGYITNKAIGFPISGRNGKLMEDHWNSMGGPSTYGTIAVHGFPNLFLVKGPNTVTGHSSAILVAEKSVNAQHKMALFNHLTCSLE